MMTEERSIAIVGAGIAGLCSAYWLEQRGYHVEVFEKRTAAGGVIRSGRENGFLFEAGPNSTLETSEVLKKLVDELDLTDQRVYANPSASKRYILKNGQLHAVPTSIKSFITTNLFSWKAKLRLLREPFISPTSGDDVSLADFVRHRLGGEFLDYAINPFVAGVYAGDPKNLSTAIGFPKLFDLEKKYGSLIKGAIKGARERRKRKEVAKNRAKMFSFKNGMQTLTDTLAKNFKGPIQYRSEITSLEKLDQNYRLSIDQQGEPRIATFDMVVLTPPAHVIGPLLKEFAPMATAPLTDVYYPPVSVVFTAYQKKDIEQPLDGFGFLIPEKENREILGTIWNSAIFPNRAPEGMAALTSFIGGTRQPENARLPESELIDLVKDELRSIMGIKGEPVLTKVKKWEKAIPQYQMGYHKIQELFDNLEEENSGLYFAGNYRRGISVGDTVLSAHETVERIESLNQI